MGPVNTQNVERDESSWKKTFKKKRGSPSGGFE